MRRLDHTELFTFSIEHFFNDMDINWTLFIYLSWTYHLATYHSTSLWTNCHSRFILFHAVCWNRDVVYMSTCLWCSLIYLWWSMLFVRTCPWYVWLDRKWHIDGTWHIAYKYCTDYTSLHTTSSDETRSSDSSWTATVGKSVLVELFLCICRR